MTVSVSRSSLRALSFGLVGASALALGGCMGSPTYGTDKTASAQLLEDVVSSVSVIRSNRRNEIEYQPRPDLVKPETTAVLPQPQDSVTSTAAAGWPESPEQRLARIRADAAANRDNPGYRAQVINDIKPAEEMTAAEQRHAFRQARSGMSGTATSRRLLSEPPLEYRVPASSAPVGELGESEDRKARAAIRESKKRRRGGTIAGETPLSQ